MYNTVNTMNTSEGDEINVCINDIITNERYIYVIGLDNNSKAYLRNLIYKCKGIRGGLPTVKGTRLWVYDILRDFIYDGGDNVGEYLQYNDFVNASFLYVDEHLNDFITYFKSDIYTDDEPFVECIAESAKKVH